MIYCGNPKHDRNAKVYHETVTETLACYKGEPVPNRRRDGALIESGPYSNEALGREAAQSLGSRPTGGARIAAALLRLPFELRAAAATEARIFANTSPGWRQSDAAIRVVERFLTGDTSTPLTKWNSDMLAKERRGEVVAGKW